VSTAAPDDVLHGAEHLLLARHGLLGRKGIGFVENKVPGRAVEVVEALGEVGHKADALVFAKERQVDHQGEVLLYHEACHDLARAGGNRDVGMVAAGDDDGQAGAFAVRRGAEAPPHADRVDYNHGEAGLDDLLHEHRSRVGLTHPSLSENGEGLGDRLLWQL
jgi:hypothetical protein